jgi:c-di-AMP phosphodiesterase-like protein
MTKEETKNNLVPIKTAEEAKARGRAGGFKSGQTKRRNKLLSQIYAEMLAERYGIKINGQDKKISGDKLIKIIARDVLMQRNSASVSMLKEIREATEGNKLALSGEVDINVLETDPAARLAMATEIYNKAKQTNPDKK